MSLVHDSELVMNQTAAAVVQAAVDLVEVAETESGRWCSVIAGRLLTHLHEPRSDAPQGLCIGVTRTAPDGQVTLECCAAAGWTPETLRQKTSDVWASAMVAGSINSISLKPGVTCGAGWCSVLAPVRGPAGAAMIGVQTLDALASHAIAVRVECLMPAIESSYWRCIGRLALRRLALLQRLAEAPRRVVKLLAEGFSEREIAVKINKSPHTVHDHVKTIYAVIGATKRADLIRYWHGLESAPD